MAILLNLLLKNCWELSLFYPSVGAVHGCVVAVAVCVASRGGSAWVRLVCSCIVVCLDVLCAVIFRLGASCFLPVVFARCASLSQ